MADDLNLLHGTVTDGGGNKEWTNPGNANDGVTGSFAVIGSFAAGAGTYTGYLESDLGSPYDVSELVVWGDVECASDPTTGLWRIESSDDGSSWSALTYTESWLGIDPAIDMRVRYVLAAPETHRYWRLVYERVVPSGFAFLCGSDVHTFEIFGTTSPTEPPVDPGYDPPEAGHAILEIYVHDESASRWDVATWGDNDGIVEGTEGVWSGAGWQDVTPQGVTAHVSWGTSRPERGILAQQESADWQVTTYDPDRKLDPGNVDSPFYPQIVSGVPIRISSAMSGVVIRTGIIDQIEYAFRAPDYKGSIRASSTIAALHRNDVPEDASLDNTLRGRLRDVVLTAGIAIGGIPVLGSDDSYPDIPLSDKPTGQLSAWDHIRRAGEETLWVIYEDSAGTLQSRPYGGPVDRGREITYENLEDLTSRSGDDGVYSVVRVLEDDGVTVIERVAAPLPRYGRIVYDDRETLTTIGADSWADAVLADRAWPGIVWIPGTVWAFDQSEVDYFASLELMERVQVVVPGAIDLPAVVLGMEMWVEQRTSTRARWLFLPRLATAGATSLGITSLVADDGSGDYLMADDGSGDYLEEG